MRADPEPDKVLALAHREGAIPRSDANREDGSSGVHLLEAEARMLRVVPEQLVGAFGAKANGFWECR